MNGQEEEKIIKQKTYIEAQKHIREAIEREEAKKIEIRLTKMAEKAKIDPNIIWNARKRAQGSKELEYNTITEAGEIIMNAEETKSHIANYFEDLYQAREGKPEFQEWTDEITTTVKTALQKANNKKQGQEPVTIKKTKKAIKKLKRKKSQGPDDIPNEIFLEANRETTKTLTKMINNVHEEESIPKSWLEGKIIRLYKGKGQKGKCSNERGITLASNVEKVYERVINERVKEVTQITDAQAGGKEGSATTDHLIALKQIVQEIRNEGKTAYVIFLDVQKAYDKAWLDAILYVLNKNGVDGKNLSMVKKLNSQLTASVQTRYGPTREIEIRDSIRQGGVLSVIEYAILIDEISKEIRKRGLGLMTKTGNKVDSLLWMDDVCLIHFDQEKLQEILNVTNYVAQKYHIEFGAAKCKVVKIGKGTKSEIRLNNQILEEVTSYKYLGELINNKGNLEDHLTATQNKIRAITAQIIAETGNKEFKGIKMKAIWQLVDATIIPILTYAAEGWNYTKEEIEKTQTIFNEALKTILFLPQGTPTTILLNETGYPAIEDIIKKKRIMQAHRVINMKKNPLIKKMTQHENSTWMKRTNGILEEFKVKDEITKCSKNEMKNIINKKIMEMTREKTQEEAENKTKTKHWWENIENRSINKRPEYLEKLNRKECNAIIKTRTSMLPVKMNQKNKFQKNTKCRYCKNSPETQKHIIEECEETPWVNEEIKYKNIFQNEDVHALKTVANRIIRIVESIENHNEVQSAWAPFDEPPGYLGECNTTTTTIRYRGLILLGKIRYVTPET